MKNLIVTLRKVCESQDDQVAEFPEYKILEEIQGLQDAFKSLYQTKDLATQERRIKELASVASNIKKTMEYLTHMNQSGKTIKFV